MEKEEGARGWVRRRMKEGDEDFTKKQLALAISAVFPIR
jgi:hypothetical protein